MARPGRKTDTRKRAQACRLFSEGYMPRDVAEKVEVSYRTAIVYQKFYQKKMQRAVIRNKDFFDKVVEHTLQELDVLAGQAKWIKEIAEDEEEPSGVRISAFSQLRWINEQRQKLKRLLDQKVEITHKVEEIRVRQDRIINFMEDELCPVCIDRMRDFFQKEVDAIAKVSGLV